MKVAGIWSGHDCSYAVLDSGRLVIHAELERIIREKEPKGDAFGFLFDTFGDHGSIKHLAMPFRRGMFEEHGQSLSKMLDVVKQNGGRMWSVGHHQSHAANAFFTSRFDDAMIMTIDGGGTEVDGTDAACAFWEARGNAVRSLRVFPLSQVNIGGVWTRATRYVFKLQSGWPRGHQAGTVMAMAAFGDPTRYVEDFHRMLTVDLVAASLKPPTQPKGALVPGGDPIHPYLDRWARIADKGEQERFDLAAGLQAATERVLFTLLLDLFDASTSRNLCFAGGVALNSVAIGKLMRWSWGRCRGVHVTPTPHDGGLTVGAAQHVWHCELGNPRVLLDGNFSPYGGFEYSADRVAAALAARAGEIDVIRDATDADALGDLTAGMVVSVYAGRAECGRRALGNRSILADPRDHETKARVNERVKHRQWFRPFAPSILREDVKEWFWDDVDSPYMSFVATFRADRAELVPAVVHRDQSARLQTVTEGDNSWYYRFLKKWKAMTGVPMLLNTSLNDSEPICDSPDDALKCFLDTDIDRLYFPEYGIMVKKRCHKE